MSSCFFLHREKYKGIKMHHFKPHKNVLSAYWSDVSEPRKSTQEEGPVFWTWHPWHGVGSHSQVGRCSGDCLLTELAADLNRPGPAFKSYPYSQSTVWVSYNQTEETWTGFVLRCLTSKQAGLNTRQVVTWPGSVQVILTVSHWITGID